MNRLALALVISGTALYAEAAPSLERGTPYPRARNQLIEAGWTPVAKPAEQRAYSCLRFDDRCARYREAAACSGTGHGLCRLIWRKGSDQVVVITEGDAPRVTAVSRCHNAECD